VLELEWKYMSLSQWAPPTPTGPILDELNYTYIPMFTFLLCLRHHRNHWQSSQKFNFWTYGPPRLPPLFSPCSNYVEQDSAVKG